MPTYVRTDKCDGCKGQDKTACMYICPHDLMALDKDGSQTGHAMKAWNQEPEQCWECYSCVKICPQNAIEVRHYADIVPLGGSVNAWIELTYTSRLTPVLTQASQTFLVPSTFTSSISFFLIDEIAMIPARWYTYSALSNALISEFKSLTSPKNISTFRSTSDVMFSIG